MSEHVSVDPALVRELQRRSGQLLAIEQKARKARGEGELAGDDERQLGRQLIQQVIGQWRAELVEAGQDAPAWAVEEQLAAAIEARQFGAGELQSLLDDEDLENIDINGCDEVFVTGADGRRRQVRPVAANDEELVRQIQTLAAYSGLSSRPFDAVNSQLDLRMPDGSRLSAIQTNTPRPAISIRRHRFMKATLEDLIGNDTLTAKAADFLRAAVKARLNIMVAGSTDAGKTTLLRALTSAIDPSERIITVEKALEIGLGKNKAAHPNVVEMEESLPNSEGVGGVPMADLVRRTLRMNPDRVIVGEVLGPEIVSMLNAMSQGNDGSLSTIHARSSRGVFGRIGVYAKQAEERLDLEATAQLTASALDLVVFMRKERGGRRTLREILEVNGFDNGAVTSSMLFIDDGGTAVPNPNAVVSEMRREQLEDAGWRDPGLDGWH